MKCTIHKMIPVTKSSLFDEEIARTAAELEELITSNAPFVEVDACHVKLSSLIEEKRKHLYSAPDPSYFLDQFFACPTIESRRGKARELAEYIFNEINEILETGEEYDPVDLETYSSILDFFTYFADHDTNRLDQDLQGVTEEEVGKETSTPAHSTIVDYADLSENLKYYMGLVMNQLVYRHFLSPQNARYLKGRFANSEKMTGFSRVVIWEQDAHSLTTTFVVAQALGEAILGTKTKRNEAFLLEPEIQPNFASFLKKNFKVTVGGGSTPTFFRVAQEVYGDLGVFWKIVEMARDKLRPSYAPQKQTPHLEDLLLYFFDRIRNSQKIETEIKNQCKHLDFDVLEAFAEAIRTDRLQSNA